MHGPDDVEPFWRERAAQARAAGEVVVGFAPCRAECAEAQQQTLRRLAVAKRVGVLDEAAACRWLARMGRPGALDRVHRTHSLSDTLDGFRLP